MGKSVDDIDRSESYSNNSKSRSKTITSNASSEEIKGDKRVDDSDLTAS